MTRQTSTTSSKRSTSRTSRRRELTSNPTTSRWRRLCKLIVLRKRRWKVLSSRSPASRARQSESPTSETQRCENSHSNSPDAWTVRCLRGGWMKSCRPLTLAPTLIALTAPTSITALLLTALYISSKPLLMPCTLQWWQDTRCPLLLTQMPCNPLSFTRCSCDRWDKSLYLTLGKGCKPQIISPVWTELKRRLTEKKKQVGLRRELGALLACRVTIIPLMPTPWPPLKTHPIAHKRHVQLWRECSTRFESSSLRPPLHQNFIEE